MTRPLRVILFLIAALLSADSQTVIFFEDGFPSADSAPIARKTLSTALPNATFADSNLLSQTLADAKLLVLPYGSAFPESLWTSVYSYLQRGGNLLVLGGRPFTRAAYRGNNQWQLRDYSVRFSRQLFINDYAEVAIESGTHPFKNPDLAISVPPVSSARAFSPTMRMSVKDLYPTEGSAGSLDARLDVIQWIDRLHDHSNDHVAAPVISIDHLASAFAGGRWVFVDAELPPDFVAQSDARRLIADLAAYALRGAEDFTARPAKATFLPGEPIEMHLTTRAAGLSPNVQEVYELSNDQEKKAKLIPSISKTGTTISLPALSRPGFYSLQTMFMDGGRVLRIDHSAFWVSDAALLNSGHRFNASGDFFTLDGRTTPIVGTTYMSSDVQRLFLMQPNPAVWDRDMQQIADSGLNMIRTGLWSGWPDVTNDDGAATETLLRNLEAFLLSARRHNLAVQFTFFSFLPESFGAANPYLDPLAIQKQQNFIRSIAQHFKDVPFLSYDLINEPSFSRFTWQTRPNGDALELSAWKRWLHRKYPDWPALADAWNMPSLAAEAPVPTREEFTPRGAYFGNNGLKVHDFYLFAQDAFAEWTHTMARTIRDVRSSQLITVGQDDGGYQERLNPAFFSDSVDFTTDHTWWLNDDLLWCSLVGKQPGKPMLIQETGLQRQLTPRETPRLTPQDEAALLERKLAMSFASGAGAIEWLWNVNPYITSDNEVTIGAVRTDGTLKPDAAVLRNFAHFAASTAGLMGDIEPAQVAIVTSQALQYSPWNATANAAQQRSVRAVFYYARIPAYLVPENRIATALGHPKLVVLPSPQALSEAAWQSLLAYVRNGGHLLITGPVERDQHWRNVARARELGVKAELKPLTSRELSVTLNSERLHFRFTENAQENLEELAFKDPSNLTTIHLGKGDIEWAASPIELSEDLDAVGKIYADAAQNSEIQVPFKLRAAPTSGILIYPQIMKDAVLYVIVSESAADQQIRFEDITTHASVELNLLTGHAALALIRRSDGKIVARYGF